MSSKRVIFKGWSTSLRESWQNYSQRVTASLEVSKSKQHVLVLDGVRAVACLAVLSFHATFLMRNYGIWNPFDGINNLLASLLYFGESGVILFFLLSGFLLFLPFAKALLFGGEWPSAIRFYIRRVFRIIPGYFAALLLITLFFRPEFFRPTHRGDLLEFFTFTMSNNQAQQLNGPFWTLMVEFQFYMLLPIIAWVFSLIVRRGSLPWRMTKLTCCLLVLLAWGLITRYWGLSVTATSTHDFFQSLLINVKTYVYGDTGKYFEVFAVGMLIAMVYVYAQKLNKEKWLRRFQKWSFWIFLSGLVILGFLSVAHFFYLNIDLTDYHLDYPVFTFMSPYTTEFLMIWWQWEPIGYAISYGLCVFGLLYGSSRLKRPFEWPVLRWIGMISFSLYMWHLPIIFLYMNVILHNLAEWPVLVKYIGMVAWIVFMIFPISLSFYRWIEMPGMRLGEALIRRLRKRSKPPLVDWVEDMPTEKRAEVEALL